MKSWWIDAVGAPLRLGVQADAPPGPGEARVKIAAAGLNHADLLMAQGRYQDTPALPFVPGMEISGTVTDLGPGTAGPAPGTRVMGYVGRGGFAKAGNFPADRLIPLPASISMADAAAFPIAYGTSHLALTYRAGLQRGETLFVTGAASGVGLTAVEIGHQLGARVIAAARGSQKAEVARRAGAETVLDSDADDIRSALKAQGGVDVFYDTVGGPGFDAALRAVRFNGRILAIGFASGTAPQIPANILLVKNLTVIGFWWGAYAQADPQRLRHSLQTMLDWHATGRITPQVSRSLPFDALPEAMELLRDRKITGKVVVVMDD